MAKKVKVTTDKEQFLTNVRKEIKSLRTRAGSVQQDIHKIGMKALQFAADNDGDTTLINELYHALPLSIRRASFKAWVEAAGAFKFVEKKGKGGAKHKLFIKDKSENANAYDLAFAMDNPFWNMKASSGDNEADPLTAEQLQKKVLDYLDKQIKKTNDPAVIDFAKAMRERLATAAAA